jgi:hypothetical protein
LNEITLTSASVESFVEMELVEDAVADEPQLAGQLQGPFGQHLTGDAGRLPITLDLLDRARQSDSREPLVSVRARQLCPLGDALGDALDPERGGAGKDAGATAGNGEVGDVTEAAVKVRGTETRGRRPDLGDGWLRRDAVGSSVIAGADRLRRLGTLGEGPDHSESREVDPNRAQAG